MDDLSDEDYTDLYTRITITLLEQKIFERKPLIDEILEKEKNSVKEYYKSKASKKLINKEYQEEDIKIKMLEYQLELIEKIFQFYNGIKDNLNKLPLEVVGDTSINLLAEFYLMLKSVDAHDFKTSRNIVDKFGWNILTLSLIQHRHLVSVHSMYSNGVLVYNRDTADKEVKFPISKIGT